MVVFQWLTGRQAASPLINPLFVRPARVRLRPHRLRIGDTLTGHRDRYDQSRRARYRLPVAALPWERRHALHSSGPVRLAARVLDQPMCSMSLVTVVTVT